MNKNQFKALVLAVAQAQTQQKSRPSAEEWFRKNQNVTVVRRGFKHTCKLSDGTNKEFNAVEFSNGKIGVYCKGGSVLKYAW